MKTENNVSLAVSSTKIEGYQLLCIEVPQKNAFINLPRKELVLDLLRPYLGSNKCLPIFIIDWVDADGLIGLFLKTFLAELKSLIIISPIPTIALLFETYFQAEKCVNIFGSVEDFKNGIPFKFKEPNQGEAR